MIFEYVLRKLMREIRVADTKLKLETAVAPNATMASSLFCR